MTTSGAAAGFARARRIAGYNLPLYGVASLAIVAGVGLARLPALPPAVRWGGGLAACVAAWYAGASFLAFHWMFDRSAWSRWQWLAQATSGVPRRFVQISAGLEETSAAVQDVFPDAHGVLLDIYDPHSMPEPALTRARAQHGGVAAVAARFDALPVEDGWADAVIVVLAAHEVRDRRRRERLFGELARIVSAAGRIVLVEHLRDLPAVLAFGPGVLHFYPRSEWLGLAQGAGLVLDHERRFTPFIRVFVYRRSPRSGPVASV